MRTPSRMPKPATRMTPTIWALFGGYTFIVFTIATDFAPFSPKPIINEGPYDPHEDLSAAPATIYINITQQYSREAVLYIPKRVKKRVRKGSTIKIPLLLCFHGMGKTAVSAAKKDTLWAVVADRMGFIAVFPQASGAHSENEGKTQWHTGTDDFTYVGQLMKYMLQSFNINTGQMFVTGLSNGAFFASDVFLHFEDVFNAAYIAQGGLGRILPNTTSPKTHAPVMFTVAEKDEWAPRSRAAAKAYAEAKYKTKVVSLPEQGHAYAMNYETSAWRWFATQRNLSPPTKEKVIQAVEKAYTYTPPAEGSSKTS
eukprot:TRINITY_DN66145_c6_g1_i4.p2 TRINITY_DN66145_c6_g1~~TRINITY_DN66145_c6_g1_i4.p2  ORF type:complete len:312 (-),score=33.92 TRINITY_DN66145_c6_g1_i4:1208-2143(-)